MSTSTLTRKGRECGGHEPPAIVAVLEKLLRTSQLKMEDVQAAWTASTFDQPASKLEGVQLL